MIEAAKPGKQRNKDLVDYRAQLADEVRMWEDYTKEPLTVIGTIGG